MAPLDIMNPVCEIVWSHKEWHSKHEPGLLNEMSILYWLAVTVGLKGNKLNFEVIYKF